MRVLGREEEDTTHTRCYPNNMARYFLLVDTRIEGLKRAKKYQWKQNIKPVALKKRLMGMQWDPLLNHVGVFLFTFNWIILLPN